MRTSSTTLRDPATTSRRVLVLGAGGALGTLVVHAFRGAGWKVYPAGRRPLPDPDFRSVDLDRPIRPQVLDGVDLVISTVPQPGLPMETWPGPTAAASSTTPTR